MSSPVPHDPLQGVLAIGRALRAGGGDPDAVLAAVAEAVRRATGFRGICIDRYRPAWDDFQVVLLEGDDAAREALLGKTTTWADYGELLHERYDHGGAYFIPAGSVDCWHHDAFHPSSFAVSDDPDAWHPPRSTASTRARTADADRARGTATGWWCRCTTAPAR